MVKISQNNTKKSDFQYKILIVEDDPSFRIFLKDTIKRIDCELFEAENGREGLELFHEKKPHLIISDIMMPELNGIDMLKEIKKIKSDVIVIITTNFNSEEKAIDALNSGANNYIKKPFRPKRIIQLLEKYHTILKNRTITKDIKSMIVRKEMELKFKSNFEIIPNIVDYIINECCKEDISGIELGLNEILINSVEHGNLNISYEQKTRALEADKLFDLYDERLSNPVYADREITVQLRMKQHYIEFEITDEGDGFDWENVPNPIDRVNQEEFHGRGIFLTRFQFDEMEYIGKGNMVRLKKFL